MTPEEFDAIPVDDDPVKAFDAAPEAPAPAKPEPSLWEKAKTALTPDAQGIANSVRSFVAMTEVNFTVLPNGATVLATDTDVDIFKGNKLKRIDNAPFDASNKLFNISGTVYYVDGNKIYQASMK